MVILLRTTAVLAQDSQDGRQIVQRDKNPPAPQLFMSEHEFVGAAAKTGIALGRIGVITMMLFLTVVSCKSDAQQIRATNEAAIAPPATNTPLSAENDSADAQNIRATNEAAAKPTATSTPLSAEIGSTEIRDGDCIISKLPEGINIESVVIVPCTTNWQYRALNFFTVDDFDRYPGESYFSRRAHDDCDRRYTFLLFPVADSWTLGHRTVSCLQESFGLSISDPARLDRLVGGDRLTDEECFNLAPETNDLLVELVDCSSIWQYRVLNSFAVDDLGQYPGEDLFYQRAYDDCDRRYTDAQFPSEDTWISGDRRVTCVQESFGLSITDPPKLDRLVNGSKLKLGECFNEALEAENAMMEVVSCSGEWEFKVVGSLLVPRDGTFPGEQYIEDLANQECETSSDFYFSPAAETWSLGDRAITCVKSSQ